MEEYEILPIAEYYRDVQLPTHLTERVVKIMGERHLIRKDLAARIYEQMGLGVPESAEGFIGVIRSGHSEQIMPHPSRRLLTNEKKKAAQKNSDLATHAGSRRNRPYYPKIQECLQGIYLSPNAAKPLKTIKYQ